MVIYISRDVWNHQENPEYTWCCIATTKDMYKMDVLYQERAHIIEALSSYSKDPAGIREFPLPSHTS